MSDEQFPDETLDRAIAGLPREQSPSPTFTGGVLRELNRRGLVREPRVRGPWLIAAVAIFAAGIVTGAGASLLIVRKTAPPPAASRMATTRATPPLNVPDVGHSEVWF